MQLELNGRTYLILGAIVLMGLCFEALKFWPTTQTAATVEDILELSKPYAVSEKTIKQTTVFLRPGAIPLRKSVVLPELNLKDQIEKSQKEQERIQAEEKKKKEAAKNWHWVWNKEKQKWEWKKKKKKKAEDPKKPDDAQTAAPSTVDTPATPDAQTQNPVATGPTTTVPPQSSTATGGGAIGGSGQSPQKFLTAAEWVEYLETSPSQSKTNTFVTDHTQHLVTDQTYFSVISTLLKSNNITVQQQAIYALGQDPSTQSFDTLATESNTLQTSSPLYSATNQYLQQYGQLKNLGILQQVLSQSGQNQGVELVALNQLQSSIAANLGQSTSQPSALANAVHYKGFLPILTQLAGQNSSVSAEAQSILSQLNADGIH